MGKGPAATLDSRSSSPGAHRRQGKLTPASCALTFTHVRDLCMPVHMQTNQTSKCNKKLKE